MIDFTVLRSCRHRILPMEPELLEITRRLASEKNCRNFPGRPGNHTNLDFMVRLPIPIVGMAWRDGGMVEGAE